MRHRNQCEADDDSQVLEDAEFSLISGDICTTFRCSACGATEFRYADRDDR